MRQSLGRKKVEKYRRQTGLDVIAGLVRGGTDHRVDLCLRDGTIASLWPDGDLMFPENARHSQPNILEEKA